MPSEYSVQVIEIRVSSATDATAIAQVRRESWQTAYAGIIAAPLIDRATATGGNAVYPPPYRRTLVAEAGEQPAVIGYASFGPERAVAPVSALSSGAANGQAPVDPLTPGGRAGVTGELYALYITPAWWSAGVGRELMSRVLSALETDCYQRVVLWVLTDNARARRFYELAGFAPDGTTNILTGLGGVQELRYARPIAS
jgi:ribosomal protein S18 acetylase RimI-like enzyme